MTATQPPLFWVAATHLEPNALVRFAKSLDLESPQSGEVSARLLASPMQQERPRRVKKPAFRRRMTPIQPPMRGA